MLVWRRANSARSLLLAAAFAALIATALLGGLAVYNESVIVRGAQSAVAAAPPEERSLLVQGPIRPEADHLLRTELAGWTVWEAGYASGFQYGGDTGSATKDAQGVVYASVMFLDGLREHARLVEGEWGPAMIGAAAARALGIKPGGRVPIIDRRTSTTTEVLVNGVFEPLRPEDPLWLLSPETLTGSKASTYGPLVLDRRDFEADGWSKSGSSGWIAVPDLSQARLDDLLALRQRVRGLSDLPERLGMGDGGQALTSLDELVNRLQRADLVGRSALLTPMLLIIVLGGYALLLLAGLLTEQRRPEIALLQARGADRSQLARLAAAEGILVAAPAAILVAPFAPMAVAAAAGCVIAMVIPALRGSSLLETRPSRASMFQRAGIDLALVAFAVLAWLQLRQYESPLAGVGGQLGIDPLLASAAPIGVLAASVVALRLLPPLTALVERLIDRRPWFAAQMGMWQAGRRPHAGPVLLLALAVAVSTLAWALAGTAQRSLVDQADHTAGADLRLSETGFAPKDRPSSVAALPGVAKAVPAYRDRLSLGEKSTSSTIIALDAAQAADVVRLRGDGNKVFDALVAARGKDAIAAVASQDALDVLHKQVGDEVRLPIAGITRTVTLVAALPSLPGTEGEPALLLDISDGYQVSEWWIETVPEFHAQAAAAARKLPNLRVYDRITLATQAGEDPYGIGARLALFIAAFGAIALALVGVAVDVRATARRRLGELAVLHTLGATPRLLARALVTEQGFLAGLGVTAGLTVGIGVAATMAPLVILTPSAARPLPEPLLHLDWRPVLGTAGGLLLLAMAMAALVALRLRSRLDASLLRREAN